MATILYVANVDDPDNPVETLERYERGSLRCEKTSFHMSINPSDTDGMSEEQVVEFAKELMAGLGYGNQPYIIYKHMDTGRVHYHVVSVRVDKEGKKINDSNEKRRCQALMKKLAAKYGFTIGKGKKKEADLDGKAFTSKANSLRNGCRTTRLRKKFRKMRSSRNASATRSLTPRKGSMLIRLRRLWSRL